MNRRFKRAVKKPAFSYPFSVVVKTTSILCSTMKDEKDESAFSLKIITKINPLKKEHRQIFPDRNHEGHLYLHQYR